MYLQMFNKKKLSVLGVWRMFSNVVFSPDHEYKVKIRGQMKKK